MIKKKKKKVSKKSGKKIASIVTLVCKDHEEYKAVYPPKTDCLVCWKIYANRMRRMVKLIKIELMELRNAQRR